MDNLTERLQELSWKADALQLAINEMQLKVKILEEAKQAQKTGVIYHEPDVGEQIYWLTSAGVIYEKAYAPVDFFNYLVQGNLFYDKESAELETKRRAIRHRLAKFCKLEGVRYYDIFEWYNGHIAPNQKVVNNLQSMFKEEDLKLVLEGE